MSEVGSQLHYVPTKNHRSRTIGIPAFLNDLLTDHLSRHVPDGPTALLFTSPNGDPLRNGNFWRRIWYPAVEQAQLPHGLRIHDLGHSSITVTMDRYTQLFSSDIDDLIRHLDQIRARTPAAQPRPNDRTRGIDLGGR